LPAPSLEHRDFQSIRADHHGAAIGNAHPALPVAVERLGHEAIAALEPHRRGIERRRDLVGRVAHCIELVAIREGGGEANAGLDAEVHRQPFDERNRLAEGKQRRASRPKCSASRKISSESVVPVRAA
jgi:hypothetical protein